MLGFLERHATPRLTSGLLLLLMATMFLVNGTNLPFTGPWLSRLTGGMGFLDVRVFYTGEEARTVLAAYGPAGRRACLTFYATWDVAIPLLAMAFSASGLAAAWGLQGGRRWLLLAPLAAMGFDLLENLTLSVLLIRFPEGPALLAGAAGAITLLKWISYGASVVLLLAGLGWRLRPRKGPGSC